jgi:hypothetical protein
MKKSILSFFVLFAIAASVQAQSVHVGLKLGVNLDKVKGESFKEGYNAGFLGGGFVDVGIGHSLGISGEVLFNQTDTKYNQANASVWQQGSTTISDGTKIKLNYMTIPVLLDIKAAKVLTFQLGPQVGILLNSNETLVQSGSNAFQNAFKSGNFGIVLGARINVGSLRVYGRYIIGVTNMNNASGAAAATNSDNWTSQQIQLGIGFAIL